MIIIQQLLSAVFNVVVFTAIPFLWWLVTAWKKENFLVWIGFKRVEKNYIFIAVVTAIFCAVCVAMQCLVVPYLLPAGATVQQSYTGQGVSAIVPILIFGMIKTGLSEEILFRGFLLKRLNNRFGYQIGNILQASIFGLIHGIGNCFISFLSAFSILI